MNVLMMPTWYFEKNNPLAGIFTTEQSIDLKKYCDVAVYYPFDTTMDGEFSCAFEKNLLTFRSKIIKSRIPKFTTISNIIRIIRDFKRIKKEFKPDLIHAHVAGQAGFYAVILGKLFKVPVIITEHCPPDMLINNKRSYNIVKYVYKNSKRNICVSRHLSNSLNEIYPNIKFDVIYNGIKQPIIDQIDISNKIEINQINISFVASFYDKNIKGMQYLLPAIKKLIGKGYKLQLHIVGGGEFEEYYIEKSKELGIFDNCKFYGYRSKEEVLSIVNMTDFMISSSLTETFGCAIAEALMLGKPVVITDSGGPQDFVNDKVGIIVKKESTEELVRGMEAMIRDLNNYDNSSIAEYSKQEFGISFVSKKYMKIYNIIT